VAAGMDILKIVLTKLFVPVVSGQAAVAFLSKFLARIVEFTV
jgi:hypothetical protein